MRFPSTRRLQSDADLIKLLNETFKGYLQFRIRNKLITIVVPQHTIHLEFLAGLHFTLGFSQTEYNTSITKEIRAYHAPQLNRAINNMYIYASICEAIQVGDVRVPLLKSIWLDVDKFSRGPFSRRIHMDIKNPMYVPVGATAANCIEVNIRTDSGELVPFAPGAITSLTLHFRKHL